MSISPIAKAIALGYGLPQVLQFVERAFPSLSPRIKKAKDSGYPIEKILGIIDKGMGGSEDFEGMTESQIHTARDEEQGQLTKDLLKAGIGAAGGFALSRAVPEALGGIQGLLGKGKPSPQPPIGPQPMANAPVQTPPIPPVGPSSTQATPTPPPVPDLMALPPGTPIATALGPIGKDFPELGQFIERQIKKGMSPREAAAEAKKKPLFKNLAAHVESDYGKPLEDIVEYGMTGHISAQSKENQPQQKPELTETQPEEQPKKGQIVATPSGIGELHDVKQSEALVNQDGKLHKVKTDELISSPLPEKDLAELYGDLISGIEKETNEDVSRMVNFAGYDPKSNTLMFLPHTGALYEYSNITPEDAAELTNILNVRKTSGENFIGAWKQGSHSPIGAALSKMIIKLQKDAGGKGKEYLRKFETVYSALEPAIQAAKKKKRKK